MSHDVRDRVIKVVAETLKIEPAESKTTRGSSKTSARIDAKRRTDHAFEEEFDIEMDEEEALDVKTIGKAVDFIVAHLG